MWNVDHFKCVKNWNIYCFEAWFQQQDELETPIEEIPPAQFTLSSLIVTYAFTLVTSDDFTRQS